MKRAWLAACSMALLVGVSTDSGSLSAGETKAHWKGSLQVCRFLFGGAGTGAGHLTFNYDVYQNTAGVVRRELKYLEPGLGGGVGVGRDVHIIDFGRGTLVALDKDKKTAVRRRIDAVDADPLAAPSARLPAVEILGFTCEGAVNRVRIADRLELRESWLATMTDFKLPLVNLVKGFGPSENLAWISIETVTRLERTEPLPESLFQLPAGYEVVDLDSVGTPGRQ